MPLLFLKSAPEGAPAANAAAPAAAEAAKLPARAARLLATTDPGAPGGQAKGSAQDPFAPPASYRAAAAAAAQGRCRRRASPRRPPARRERRRRGGDADQADPGRHHRTEHRRRRTKPNPRRPELEPEPVAAPDARATPSVDIRFGTKNDTKIRRAIPRQKGFYIHGKLVAVFVKYSPSRKAAVFAVAPGLHISGPTSSAASRTAPAATSTSRPARTPG